jgi:hypothetical protein
MEQLLLRKEESLSLEITRSISPLNFCKLEKTNRTL